MDEEGPFSPSSSPNFTLHNPLSEELEPTAPEADAGVGEVNIILPMMAPQDSGETDMFAANEDDVATAEEGAVGGEDASAARPLDAAPLEHLVEVADENHNPKVKREVKKSLREKHQS